MKCARLRRNLTGNFSYERKKNSSGKAIAIKILWGGVENILIVRLDAIGDMILTSGFIREVRANFPKARITLVVSSLVFPIVELCPYVNEVLTFDTKSLDRNFPVMLEKIAVFCRDNLWKKKFSFAFSPQCGGDNFPGIVMMWLSGARERIGYDIYPYRNFFNENAEEHGTIGEFMLNRMIKPHRTMSLQVDKHFYVLTESGFNVNETHMELFYGAADLQRAKELLEDIPPHCKKVMLCLGSREMNKKYPVEKYLVALRELAAKDLVFVIAGGRGDIAEANFIEQNLPRGKVLNLTGKTTLRETEAVVSQTDYYIGNDTGVLHMAAAAKVPVVGIYRESVDKDNVLKGVFNGVHRFAPYQTKAVILRPEHPLGDCATLPPVYGGCHHREPHCITQITPQQIVEGFDKLMTL